MEYLNGLIDLPWWVMCWWPRARPITIASVTIHLCHQAHRALDLHPPPSHFSASGCG